MKGLPARTKGPIRVSILADDAPMDAATRPESEWQMGERRDHQPASQRLPVLKLLRFPEVRERTGLSRSTIWRLERIGAFPKHRQISANAVAWLEHEVLTWIRSKSDSLSA
jgi:prophage regulatory protein